MFISLGWALTASEATFLEEVLFSSSHTLLKKKSGATEKAQIMLLLLQLILLLWPRGASEIHKAKCLLTLEQGEVDPDNHYKSGDYFISGIISARDTRFDSLSFDRNPSIIFLE